MNAVTYVKTDAKSKEMFRSCSLAFRIRRHSANYFPKLLLRTAFHYLYACDKLFILFIIQQLKIESSSSLYLILLVVSIKTICRTTGFKVFEFALLLECNACFLLLSVWRENHESVRHLKCSFLIK